MPQGSRYKRSSVYLFIAASCSVAALALFMHMLHKHMPLPSQDNLSIRHLLSQPDHAVKTLAQCDAQALLAFYQPQTSVLYLAPEAMDQIIVVTLVSITITWELFVAKERLEGREL